MHVSEPIHHEDDGSVSLPSIACIAIRSHPVSKAYGLLKEVCTYFPLFTESMPKLDPTSPVQVQFSSAAFVHLAVAVVPTLRQVIDADAGERAKTTKASLKMIVMFAMR